MSDANLGKTQHKINPFHECVTSAELSLSVTDFSAAVVAWSSSGCTLS